MGLLILEVRGIGCDLAATLRAELMRIRRSEDAVLKYFRYLQAVFSRPSIIGYDTTFTSVRGLKMSSEIGS
jgi:hydroxymethylpyrimidine/phosphomethylpyrimidine kinase